LFRRVSAWFLSLCNHAVKPAATEGESKLGVPDRNNCICAYVHEVIVN